MIRKCISLTIFMFNMYPTFYVNSLRQTLRRKVLIRQRNKCGLCNCNFSIMRPHEIHHLNHNPKDNNSSNLLALCANCHTAHHRFGVAVMPFYKYRNATDYSFSEPEVTTAYYE